MKRIGLTVASLTCALGLAVGCGSSKKDAEEPKADDTVEEVQPDQAPEEMKATDEAPEDMDATDEVTGGETAEPDAEDTGVADEPEEEIPSE